MPNTDVTCYSDRLHNMLLQRKTAQRDAGNIYLGIVPCQMDKLYIHTYNCTDDICYVFEMSAIAYIYCLA